MKYLPWVFLALVVSSFYLHYQLVDWGDSLSPKRGYYFASFLRLEPATFARLFILLACAGALAYLVYLVRTQGVKLSIFDLVVAAGALASFSLAVAAEFPASRRGLLIKAMTTGLRPTYNVSREEYPELMDVPSVRKLIIAEMASYEGLMVYAALRLEGLTNDAILERHPGVIARMVQMEGSSYLEEQDGRYLAMLKRHRVQPEGTFLYGCLPYPWAKEQLHGLVAKGIAFPLDICFEHPGLVSREDAWKLMELLTADLKKKGGPVHVQAAYMKNVASLHGFLAGKVPDGKAALSVSVLEEGGSIGAEKLAGLEEGFSRQVGDMIRLCGYEVEEGAGIEAVVKVGYETRPGKVWREETRTVRKLVTESVTRYRSGEMRAETVKKWVEEDEKYRASYQATLKHYPRATLLFEVGGKTLELSPPRRASSDEKGGELVVDVLKPGEYQVDASNEPDYLAVPWSREVFQ